jgi:subtilisin family serine protease
MDPNLWELLSDGSPDDEVTAIIRLRKPGEYPPGIRKVAEFGELITCRLRREDILATRTDPRVESMKAPVPVIEEPTVVELGEETLLPMPSDVRRPATIPFTGKDVVVGVVDWGADFTFPSLCNDDGTTRFIALWDQRGAGDGNRYGYGKVHRRAEIDQALKTADPFETLHYDPADSDPERVGSHGTHVLDIAAGNGRHGGPEGLAPEATLAFVQLGGGDTAGLSNLGDSSKLLEAVDFIFREAGERPCVINLSLGNHGGPHDGSTLVEQALDATLTTPGRAICQSTGNYFERGTHTALQLRPGEDAVITWETQQADRTPNELEIWYSRHDRFVVEVVSPTGQSSGPVELGQSRSLSIDGIDACRIYHRASDPNNRDHLINVFHTPTAPAGIWEVRISAEDVADGRLHAWIERDESCRGCQSRFSEDQAVQFGTTGTICNGLRTIAVGAHENSTQSRSPSPFSSMGPTRDGRQKPDLSAPGSNVLAARSSRHDGQGTPLTRKSGTSMAAPHVTGTVALMFEAAGQPLAIEQTRRLLLSSADASLPEFRNRTGSGYLNAARAVEAATSHRKNLEGTGDLSPQEDLSAPEADLEPKTIDIEEVPVRIAEEVLVEQTRSLGRLGIGERIFELRPIGVALRRSNSLDELLRFAFGNPDYFVISGNLMTEGPFEIFRWSPGSNMPNAAGVVSFDAQVDLCCLLLRRGNSVRAFFPSSVSARTRRWIEIPRAREFYALVQRDRDSQRGLWINAIRRATATQTVEQLQRLSMPAVRLLLAQWAEGALPIRDVDQPERKFRGAKTDPIGGLTSPFLRFPVTEPDCYLPVISRVEAKLEGINAYDLGAGISLGPIQINVIRGALFQFLWKLWVEDRTLFQDQLGRPLNWSMRFDPGGIEPSNADDSYTLIAGAGTNQIVLMGRGAAPDVARNFAYFQSGDPTRGNYNQINTAFRRQAAERFRNIVVWPHVQEMLLETSSSWLSPALTKIDTAGIPRLDPANPDRNTYILKALLFSSYVRFSGYLRHMLNALNRWPTPAQKLANWESALDSALNPTTFPAERRPSVVRHREVLRSRLRLQRAHAEELHDLIGRLRAPGRAESTDLDLATQPFQEAAGDSSEDEPGAPCGDGRTTLNSELIAAVASARTLAGETLNMPTSACAATSLCPTAFQPTHSGGNATHLVGLSTLTIRVAELAGLFGKDLRPVTGGNRIAKKAGSGLKVFPLTQPFSNLSFVAIRRGTRREIHLHRGGGGRFVMSSVDGATWQCLPFWAHPNALYTPFKRRYREASLHRQWGTQATIEWVKGLCNFYLDRTGDLLGVGDISHIVGEEMTDHGSHRVGKDVDVYVLGYPAASQFPEAYWCDGSAGGLTLQTMSAPTATAPNYNQGARVSLAAAQTQAIFTKYATVLAYSLVRWETLHTVAWHGVTGAETEAVGIARAAFDSGWRPTWGPAPSRREDIVPPDVWRRRRTKLVGEGSSNYGAGKDWPPHHDHLHIRLR